MDSPQLAFTGSLLTLWSPQVPAAPAQYHGVVSPVMANYVSKTEGLVCSAIEAHEHSIQLLEALTKIFPAGEGYLRVMHLLSGLACTVYPTRGTLYKQLGNLCILRRESALHAANKSDEPILNVLRKAPVLSFCAEEQYSADKVAQVAVLEQSPQAPEHSVCGAYTRVSARQQEGMSAALKTVLWVHPGWHPWAWLQRA